MSNIQNNLNSIRKQIELFSEEQKLEIEWVEAHLKRLVKQHGDIAVLAITTLSLELALVKTKQ